RPVRLVLLHLRPHHAPPPGVPLDRPQGRGGGGRPGRGRGRRVIGRFPEGGATMRLATTFTNFGPYHLARLRALAARGAGGGGGRIACGVAPAGRLSPGRVARGAEPFDWVTLFPERAVESLSGDDCRRAIRQALERDRPDAVAVAGYVRPESMAA